MRAILLGLGVLVGPIVPGALVALHIRGKRSTLLGPPFQHRHASHSVLSRLDEASFIHAALGGLCAGASSNTTATTTKVIAEASFNEIFGGTPRFLGRRLFLDWLPPALRWACALLFGSFG